MKNVFVLPTDKPSRVYYNNNDEELQVCEVYRKTTLLKENRNIYITSDEEIKKGDWFYCFQNNNVLKCFKKENSLLNDYHTRYAKIILTTDPDLIKDSVQAIDDDFLEWFVKNPSCKEIEVIPIGFEERENYLTIIPKEEPKQGVHKVKEQLIIQREPDYFNYDDGKKLNFSEQQEIEKQIEKTEKRYSEEEVLGQLNLLHSMKNSTVDTFTDENDYITIKWFEQFKKK
jgi:hypothetical protein